MFNLLLQFAEKSQLFQGSFIMCGAAAHDPVHDTPSLEYRYPTLWNGGFIAEEYSCSLSNNRSENSIRPLTVCRKNWLFSSSVDGAEASINIYTIIEMAKLHGLNRQKYIEYILEHRPSAEMTDEELSLLF